MSHENEHSQSAGNPDVLILPGIPGLYERVPSGEGAYPVTTNDVIKMLREKGLNVEYSEARNERAEVGHNAADLWIPVLLFVQQTSWDVVVSYVTAVITNLIGLPDTSTRRLHVKVGIRRSNGEETFFDGSGKARDVLAAMRQVGIDDR